MLNNMKFTARTLALFGMLGALASCHVDQHYENSINRDLNLTEALKNAPELPQNKFRLDTVTSREEIWLGDKSVKLGDGDPLPAKFESDNGITLVGTRPVNLMEVVEQLTTLTGIPVRVDELSLSDVLDKIDEKSGTSEESMENENTPTNYTMTLSYSGRLSGLLDQISARFSMWWRYKDGVVSFYEQETRVFTVYALPVVTQLDASIGGTSSNSGSTGSGGTATGSTDTTSNMKVTAETTMWKQLEAALKGMMPDKSSYSVEPSNGTVTVTAPPFTLKKVGKYIKDLNSRLSRQVAISVRVLNVEMNEGDDYGLDIAAVFSDNGLNLAYHSVAAPAVATGVADLGMSIVNATGTLGKWNGSKAIINALSTKGRVSLVTSATVTTLNNKVAPVQVSRSTSFIETFQSNISDGGSTTVTPQPGKINEGFTLEVLPRILDHGRMLIMFTLTITELVRMDSEDFTTDGNKNIIQLPVVKTRGFIQEIAMASGNTLALSGFEEVRTALDASGMGSADSPVGREIASRRRNVMVVLLTPEVLVSPLSPETRVNDR